MVRTDLAAVRATKEEANRPMTYEEFQQHQAQEAQRAAAASRTLRTQPICSSIIRACGEKLSAGFRFMTQEASRHRPMVGGARAIDALLSKMRMFTFCVSSLRFS